MEETYMEDKTCFCCGAEMKIYETERSIYYYCFECIDDKEAISPIEKFASEYENLKRNSNL